MDIILKEYEDLNEQELYNIKQVGYVSIDTETTGLDYINSKLCTIQIFSKNCSIILRFDKDTYYRNLVEVLESNEVIKIFHNAVFDCFFLINNLNLKNINNIVCTKISSKILNGIDVDNSLKGLLFKYLGINIDKQQQLSDWTSNTLTQEQIDYAMNDVSHLYNLWVTLKKELIVNKLIDTAEKCFNYIPIYIQLYNKGIKNIFEY